MQGEINSMLSQQLSGVMDENQYVTFSIDDEEFGIEILKVQEIVGYTKPTHMPSIPDFIKGVINLRGVVIPIIDLRKKFNIPEKEYDKFTVIIVLEIAEKTMGIIVDAVSDVLSLTEKDIQETPDISRFKADVLKGMGKVGDKLVILLDIDKILTYEEHEMVNEIR